MLTVRSEPGIIEISLDNEERFTATIMDVRGRIVGKATGSAGRCRFDRTELGSGRYLVQAVARNAAYTERLMLWR